MADVNAVASGDWVAGAASVWDGGVVPTAGQTVNLAGFTVDIENAETTNAIGNLDAASGGGLHIKDGGKLRLAGLATFSGNETLTMEGGAEIAIVCTVDDEVNRYIYLPAGTFIVQNAPTGNLAKIYGEDNTRRPDRGLHFTDSGISCRIDGLEIYDIYSYGFRGNAIYRRFPIKNLWIHDCVGHGLNLTGGPLVKITNLCIGSCGTGLYCQQASLDLANAAFGVDLDGNADANTKDFGLLLATLYGRAIRTTDTPASTKWGRFWDFQDYGYNRARGIIPASGTPGIYKGFYYAATIETVGATRLITPTSNLVSPVFAEALLPEIPADGADVIDVSCTVTLNGSQTADTVDLVIDPDGVYGGPVRSTQNTPQSTQTELTAQLTMPAGSYSVRVPVEVQVDGYNAGGEIAIDAASFSIGTSKDTLDMASWEWDATTHRARVGGGLARG